jgi:hypothetical protein
LRGAIDLALTNHLNYLAFHGVLLFSLNLLKLVYTY